MVNDSNIITIDSIESKMKVNKFSGNQRQETREGRNRCTHVIGELPKTYVSTPTGYVATNVHFDDEFVEKWQENGFTIKVKAKNALSKGAFTRFILDDTWNKRLAYSSFSKRIEDDYNIYESYVSNTDYNLFSDKRFIIMWEDTTEQTGCDLYAIEIDLGNTVGQEMEEYGASPSLDYPSEVRAVGDNVNLFDENAEKTNTYINETGKETIDNGNSYIKTLIQNNIKKHYIMSYKNNYNSTVRFSYYNNETFISGQLGNTNNAIFTVPDNCNKIDIRTNVKGLSNFYFEELKIEQGSVATSYSPYGMGSVDINKVNKNLFNKNDRRNGYRLDSNGELFATPGYSSSNFIKVIPKMTYSFNWAISLMETVCCYDKEKKFIFRQEVSTRKITMPENCHYIKVSMTTDKVETAQIELGEVATDYVSHESEAYNLPIQQSLLTGDTFIKEADGWKEVHTWNKTTYDETDNFNAFVADDVFQFYLATKINPNATLLCNMFVQKSDWTSTSVVVSSTNKLYFLIKKGEYGFTSDLTAEQALTKFKEIIATNNIVLYNATNTPTKLPCKEAQSQVLDQLQNILLYDDTTHIMLDDVYPILDYDVSKIVDTTMTFEASLDENGYFVVPNYNIKCLVSYSESNIPTMPEAVETAVSVPGRDGDIPLNTIYNPIPFNIVCYTEDNLTPEEKYAEETKMNKFLNSIKNNTIKLKLESKGKYYNVKYNGQLTTTNYPKHLQFSIPLKSSSSYAKDIDESYILGNGEKESNTIKEVGAVFVIEGPAQTPKISLNDYEMFYDNVLLSNTKLVIDSNKSTVTMINREGTATNAMRYYNHEFPKIQNGNNVLKVLSGIDEDRQVNVRWFDLKL